jgi:uncharacterized protein DUF6855
MTTTDDVDGTPSDPWQLTTPPGSSEFEAYRDPDADPPALVVQVGKTQLRYHLSCIEDLHAMLTELGDWMPLGNADEQKAVKDGTVEAWGRAADNLVGGWYGLTKGLRGRFGSYVAPVLEAWDSPRSSTTHGTTACARSDQRACSRRYGIDVTTVRSWKSKRTFRASALWLCNSCSHQCST